MTDPATVLKAAIDTEDLGEVRGLMTADPTLHHAPLGYGQDGPLTWVAECRVPRRAPTPERLAIARWMIEHGSDVHQGGDGPLMRAALNDERVAMMELLVAHGADVNARWHGDYPVIFAACEALAPAALAWLLAHGADPNQRGRGNDTPLDYLLGTYARGARLPACIHALLMRFGDTRHDEIAAPGVLDILCDRLDLLAARLDDGPGLVHRRFASLDFGTTAGRRLDLRGATLVHVAAEFGARPALELLLARGADPDARGDVHGQTPLFHAVSQYGDFGLAAARLLIERGADLTVTARLPGAYDRPDHFVECTPLGYARLFPGAASGAIALLEARGAPG